MTKTSREEIVSAASQLFREKGYSETTIAEIAKRSGIRKGSIYHHIDSKEELLHEVVVAPITRMLTDLRSIADEDGSAVDRLISAVSMHLTHLVRGYPDVFVFLQEGFGVGRSSVSNLSREYEEVFEELLTEGVASGDFRSDVDHRLAAFAILGACNWIHKWYDPLSPDVPLEDMIATFSGLFLDGLRSRPA